MKKTIVYCIVILSTIQLGYTQIKVKVDERFELTSIAFSLAGVPEFCDVGIPSYHRDIIKHLTPYELTEPINFIRELNQVHRIGYAAVTATADMLEIKNGKVRLNPKYKIEQIVEFDSRWTVELFEQYIKQLNVFYKQSKFHNWFERHRPLYELAEKRFNDYFATTAMNWFKSFYGSDLTPDMNLYISCVNGNHNYSTPEGILLGVGSDENGDPSPNQGTMSLLTHEIGHHYVNPLVDKYWAQMEVAANKIYPHVQDQMAKIAYVGAKTTMIEWLNNLFVLMYAKETEDRYMQKQVFFNIDKGFIWMQRSVDFMRNFYANREKYPTIEDFMPQLIAFLNFTADNINFVRQEIEHSKPYITNIYPAPNSDISDAREIVVTFSEPMLGAYGFMGVPDNTIELEFDFDKIHWSHDYRQCVIPLCFDKMEKGKNYGVKLNPKGFISAKYFPLDEKCIDLVFKP